MELEKKLNLLTLKELEYERKKLWDQIDMIRNREQELKIGDYKQYIGRYFKSDEGALHSGYICEEYKNLPKEKDAIWSWKYEIEVERYITQQELDENPGRWRGYELGWTTNAFYTKEDALAQALKIVEARFSPEWTVEIDDRTE